MAHFAKIGLDNVVIEVVYLDNINNMTLLGEESEDIGVSFLKKLTGHQTWKQTSITQSFRKNFAAQGFVYDSNRDAFIPPKPYESWLLDETTCLWKAPIPVPSDERMYTWNEITKQWDIINGS